MLAEKYPNPEPENYLRMQEAELCNFEQQYVAEMTGYDTAPAEVKDALAEIPSKLSEARIRLDQLRQASSSAWDKAVGAYKEARNDVRDAFLRIAELQKSGGPPLD